MTSFFLSLPNHWFIRFPSLCVSVCCPSLFIGGYLFCSRVRQYVQYKRIDAGRKGSLGRYQNPRPRSPPTEMPCILMAELRRRRKKKEEDDESISKIVSPYSFLSVYPHPFLLLCITPFPCSHIPSATTSSIRWLHTGAHTHTHFPLLPVSLCIKRAEQSLSLSFRALLSSPFRERTTLDLILSFTRALPYFSRSRESLTPS